MVNLLIDPENLRLLESVIGPRYEPPNYGLFMMAALTFVPIRDKMNTPNECWLSSDMVRAVLRAAMVWPHPDPPNGWMVMPHASTKTPYAAVYLLRHTFFTKGQQP